MSLRYSYSNNLLGRCFPGLASRRRT